jgi:ring-1,2-phenylacetyl-CoA epoxidase subunit PaaB
MTDTQWPAFQVFTQASPDHRHENAGTVHAPDEELALLLARDVFVRRPPCVSLWVVPEAEILSWTPDAPIPAADAGAESSESFEVFVKRIQRGSHEHVGQVEGRSPPEAMHRAWQMFGRDLGSVWWVVPSRRIVRSDPEDRSSLFGPAADKPYRDQAHYPTETLMRQVKAARAGVGSPE